MKTNILTQGALCLSLYGVLLLFNQQTGLLIESMMNWVFILPILIYSAKAGLYPGGITAFSMAILSFLFGTFTTWFYSWSAILIGFVYGAGLYKKIRHSMNFLISFPGLRLRRSPGKVSWITKPVSWPSWQPFWGSCWSSFRERRLPVNDLPAVIL